MARTVEFQRNLIRFSISRWPVRSGVVNCLTTILYGVSVSRRNGKMAQTHTKTNTLAFLEQSSTDANTLPFSPDGLLPRQIRHRIGSCCALVQNGTVMRHHALPDRGIMIRSTKCRNEARHSTASIIRARHSGGHSSVWPVAVMWTTPPRRYGKEEQTLDRTIIRP
jgi:hypothetical protein